MPKKGENIYKRKDGRWEGRYIKCYNAGGKAQYAYVYGRTFSDVKQKMLESRIAHVQGKDDKNCNTKYKDIMQDWLSMSKMRIKESTYSRYVHLANTHILPYLGDLTLDRLSTQVVEKHIVFLLSDGRTDGNGGLAPKTTSDILTIIKGSIDYAKVSGHQVNCYLDRLIIKKTQVEMRVLSTEEQSKLLAVLLCDMDLPKLGVLLCLYTGMRIGEVCALRWENINFTEGVISIRETLQRIQNVDVDSNRKTKVVITEPKSKNSIREIPLPKAVIDLAREFKSAPEAYLLTGHIDKYMEPRTLQYNFKKYTYASGLSDVNYHALRHTFATRCVELGFDVKTLSELLGHTNVNITLNRYVHSSMEVKRASMQRFQL